MAEIEKPPLVTVDFEPAGKRVLVALGTTLLDAARQAGLPLTGECGGMGSCGQCRVIIRGGDRYLGPPSQAEQGLLAEDSLAAGYRLACQSPLLGDVKVDVPRASLVTGQRLQVEGLTRSKPFTGVSEDRVIQTISIAVPPASLSDSRGDLERVLDLLAAGHGLNGLKAGPAAIRSLPTILRDHSWQAAALLRGDEITSFLPPGARPVGMAVDLGTTKIAAYLVDLSSDETLAVEGRANPQIGFGEDVISRIAYAARKPGGARELARAVQETLAELAVELAARAGLSPDAIAEYCIAGNTAMTHLLLELPTTQLAASPFVPAASQALEARACDLGLPGAGEARIYVPPCVAGFVGADHVAMILAGELDRGNRTVLGIDIGTNTEIVLARRGQERLTALSCASGPAFEGAHIFAGMRAAAGAIERVRLDNGATSVQTVGGAPAVGICGSGILDAVAELRRTDRISARGRFQTGAPGVRLGKGGSRHGKPGSLEFPLVPAEGSGTGEEIVVTQGDIVEIQMAKGAIQAGIAVLLEAAGLQPESLDEIILAGAFGTYLNLESAIAVGMLPDLPYERFRQVGNAAGEGARQMLVSRAAREHAVGISRKLDYIELAGHPAFKRRYAQAMMVKSIQ